MSMASMVQMCASNEHFEGSSAALLLSSQLAFDCAPLASPYSTWAQPSSKSFSPAMEGPFTPAPFATCSSQGAHLQGDPDDGIHDYSFMSAIARSISYSDLLSLSNSHISAAGDVDMEYSLPLAAEEMQLGLQRMYGSGSYGGGAAHEGQTTSGMGCAAVAVEQEESRSLMQAYSGYGEDVKLSQLARSLTFPSAAAAARAREASGRGGAAAAAGRSPLLIQLESSPDAQMINQRINRGKVLRSENTCTEMSSSAATATCSAGQFDGQLQQSKAKVVQVKSESSEMTHCQNQQDHSLHIGHTKGPKQSKKRCAIVGTSSTNVKAPRVETPADVVHVRARRGQATDSHSLAERVRREKISQRMKVLQEIVPGCHKVLGKAMMLDEIINYVKSLQRQVEFLSMKLAAANQVGITSMIIEKANYAPSNVDIFGDISTSQHQLMQLEPLISSLMQ